MSDEPKDIGGKDGVSGPLQDHDFHSQDHPQQQVEGAAAQPNIHPVNQENPADHPAVACPADGAAAPVQENVPVNPRPILGESSAPDLRRRGSFVRLLEEVQAAAQRNIHLMNQENLAHPRAVIINLQDNVFNESKDSPPPPSPDDSTTDEDPTYDVDEEEKCKRDSITKSSRKRPDDDQDPPGLAKSQKTAGSSSSTIGGSTLVK